MAFERKMKQIIREHTNPSWSPMNANILYKTVELSNMDIDYIRIKLMMQGDFLKKIFSIQRIQNPILYEQFKLRVAECKLSGNVTTIKELFHCTANQNVVPIIEDNFDWRLCNRTKYGQGISFSSNPSYANLYSNLKNGKQRAMIIADVIVGKLQYGNKRTVIPVDPCDTTVDENNTVFVKYHDNEYYPKYVIYYETYPVVKKNGQRFIMH